MAYQTGTIGSASALATTIIAFSVANGWTQNGNVVSKGESYLRITSPDTTQVVIEGARNGNFSAPDLCIRKSRICITSWPSNATYHLFSFGSPDTVWCTINFNITQYMHLGFGYVQKYGNWAGGQWFHAQHCADNPDSKDSNVFSYIDGGVMPVFNSSGRECALFWSQVDNDTWGAAGVIAGKPSMLHCELRGYIWECSEYSDTELQTLHVPSVLGPTHKCNPNTFNGQTILTPYELFLLNSDGNYMSIGHVGHLRWLKLVNYNPGDILEIGSDRWMVFPWHVIDTAIPNGKYATYNDGSQSTGINGVAVRYDGP